MYSMRPQVRWLMKQNMYRVWRHPCRGKRWELHKCNSMMRVRAQRTSLTVLHRKRLVWNTCRMVQGWEPRAHEGRADYVEITTKNERRRRKRDTTDVEVQLSYCDADYVENIGKQRQNDAEARKSAASAKADTITVRSSAAVPQVVKRKRRRATHLLLSLRKRRSVRDGSAPLWMVSFVEFDEGDEVQPHQELAPQREETAQALGQTKHERAEEKGRG